MTSEKIAVATSTGHVGPKVTELARSRDFYVAVFGLEVVAESREEGRRLVLLGRDGRVALTL